MNPEGTTAGRCCRQVRFPHLKLSSGGWAFQTPTSPCFPSLWHPEHDRTRHLVPLNLSSEAVAVCWASKAPPKIVLHGRRLRVIPGLQGTSTDPANPRTQQTPAARGAGSPERSERSRLGSLRPLAAPGHRLAPKAKPGPLQTKAREDLLVHERSQDGDDGLRLAGKQPAAADCTWSAPNGHERLLRKRRTQRR